MYMQTHVSRYALGSQVTTYRGHVGHRNWTLVFSLCSKHLLPTKPSHSAPVWFFTIIYPSSVAKEPAIKRRKEERKPAILPFLPLSSAFSTVKHQTALSLLWLGMLATQLFSLLLSCWFYHCCCFTVGKKPPLEGSLLLGLKLQHQGVQCRGINPCQLTNWAASFQTQRTGVCSNHSPTSHINEGMLTQHLRFCTNIAVLWLGHQRMCSLSDLSRNVHKDCGNTKSYTKCLKPP